MPHYYFDIKDGHRLVDPSGSDLANDDAAIAKAKVLAIGVSIGRNFPGVRLFQTINEQHLGVRPLP
jgi:uncharacterized protein DUF6894